MTKGGARTASANKAVAKGMGIKTFFNVLDEIGRLNDWVSVDLVMQNLPSDFGGERNETCRSYFKELWRYGLIDRMERSVIVPCTPDNWRKGSRPKYRISTKGKKLLLIPREQRIFALAWLLVQMDNPDDFEQLHQSLNAFRTGEVPLSMFKACEVTGVICDSIKAIMYGWLEPLGFIDRTDHGTFKLDTEYYDFVKSYDSMENAVPIKYRSSIVQDNIKISTIKRLEPCAPEIDEKAIVNVKIKSENKDKVNLTMSCKIHRLFYNRFKVNEVNKEVQISPNEEIDVIFELPFEKKKISESFAYTELGYLKININEKEKVCSLPNIYLTTQAHLHEIKLANMFEELGIIPIVFTKSDRPDMIIFPIKREDNLTKFLHNDELKILVETTSTETLSLHKVKDDLDNFEEHTTKVLKINAKRTLIVGNKIANNIQDNLTNLQSKYYKFTIISIENLKYLIDKVSKNSDRDWNKIGKILMHDGIVSKGLIDSIY